MPRLNEVSTAFREKAGQARVEEVMGTFDILPVLPCDSASQQEKNPLVWVLSLKWETWERIIQLLADNHTRYSVPEV